LLRRAERNQGTQGGEIRRHLSYANVTATLALFLAMAGGAAYAVDKVNSHDVVNGTIRSIDLKNRKAVRGADVKHDTLTGSQIDEQSLNIGAVSRIGGDEDVNCDPNSASSFTTCARVELTLKKRSMVLIIVTGNQESVGGPAQAGCRITVDGVREGLGVLPGESLNDNTSPGATNGFARTFVPRSTVPIGVHHFALVCQEFSGNVRIDTPTIAVLAVGSR
jgi:hypothetical protein